MIELTLFEKAALLAVLLDAIDQNEGDSESIVDMDAATKIDAIMDKYGFNLESNEMSEKAGRFACDLAARLRDEIIAHDWMLAEPTTEENA